MHESLSLSLETYAVRHVSNLRVSPAGGWVVENEGVPPDIEVEQAPAAVRAGRDPQLEKAIETIMKELERNPPAKQMRPRYPVRVRKPL
jgi:C-terminal processing protease CtpA/Prc